MSDKPFPGFMSIKANPYAGGLLITYFEQAARLARITQVEVEISLNSTLLHVRPGDSTQDVADQYNAAINS